MYKRQEEEDELPFDISGDEIHLEDDDYGVWSVSYTHLDVYKRQVEDIFTHPKTAVARELLKNDVGDDGEDVYKRQGLERV